MMTRIAAALRAAALGVAVAMPARVEAAPMDYTFRFTAFGGHEVAGIVRGLDEGVNSVDTIEVLSNTGGYGVGTYTHNFGTHMPAFWTVTGGAVTDWFFASFGVRNSPPDVTNSSILLGRTYFGIGSVAGLTDSATSVTHPTQVPVFQAADTAPVPVPAPIGLLAAALAGLGLLARRRKTA